MLINENDFEGIVDKLSMLDTLGLVIVISQGTTAGVIGNVGIGALLMLLGPIGIPGVIAFAVSSGFIASFVSKHGLDAVVGALIKKLENKNKTKSQVLHDISVIMLPQDFKNRCNDIIERNWE